VSFSKPPRGSETLMPPAANAVPADDTDAGADMFVWEPVIGPAESTGPATPNPMSVEAPGIDASTSLAAQLNWKI
jgi:hypothetical protein